MYVCIYIYIYISTHTYYMYEERYRYRSRLLVWPFRRQLADQLKRQLLTITSLGVNR